MKVINEIVVLFVEDDGKPIGMLHQNGHAEFYKVSKANKDYINELLGCEVQDLTKKKE